MSFMILTLFKIKESEKKNENIRFFVKISENYFANVNLKCSSIYFLNYESNNKK